MVNAQKSAAVVIKLVMALAIVSLLMLIVVSIAIAFNTSSVLSLPPKGFTLSWFQKTLQPWFFNALLLSVEIATISTLSSLAISLPASFAVARYQFYGKDFLNNLFLSPLVVPGVITGAALLFYFRALHLQLVFPDLLIAHIIITFPLIVRTLAATFEGLDKNIEDAARNLGANSFRTFFSITVPQIYPAVIGASIMSFILSLDNVPVSIFLTSSTSATIPVELFYRIYNVFDPTIAAASLLMLLFALVFVIIFDRILGIQEFFELKLG